MQVVHTLPTVAFNKPKPILKNRHERRIQHDRRAQERREQDRVAAVDRRDHNAAINKGRRSIYSSGEPYMSTPLAPYMNQAILLDFLGQQPIVFQRVYVDITGSVIAALWLSNAISKITEKGSLPVHDGIFSFSLSGPQCEEETGITRHQQLTCRRLLIGQGLLSVDTFKTQTIVFHLHLDVLAQKMMDNASSLAKVLQDTADAVHAQPQLNRRSA